MDLHALFQKLRKSQIITVVLLIILMSSPNCFCRNQQQPLTQERKVEAATNAIITYFDKVLIGRNIVNASHLQKLLEAPELINPLGKEERYAGDIMCTVASQLDDLITKYKSFIDLARVKTWVQTKIQELEELERTRQRVHEETREVHVPERFVEIPAGKYVDAITHKEFEIVSGTEIQETPVTQLQWAQIMGENPSHFVDGIDSEEVLIKGKKIKMRPDAPVENVSYNQIQEFITKLNEHDKDSTNYTYALPSVQEYQVLMQSVLGSNWLEQIRRMKTCGDTEKTCTVTVASGDSMLTHSKQRVFGFVGHVWQWTQDMIELGKYEGENINAHLIFGSSYVTHGPMGTTMNDLLRPIWYSGNINKNIGFRLVRHAKHGACEQTVARYPRGLLSWDENDPGYDEAWHWNKKLGNLFFSGDEFAWMIEHKSEYPQETQHTIDVLLQKVPDRQQNPIVYLTRLTELNLEGEQIEDLSPLIGLIKLTKLDLSINQIKDLTPLANLTGLARLLLGLAGNQFRDLTPLANLTGLTMLDLGENHQIEDLTPLANLTRLRTLLLRHNRIKDLTPLAGLTNLTRLQLCYNQIKDLTPLNGLTNLADLDICHNPVDDFTPLAPLRGLNLEVDRGQQSRLGHDTTLILPHITVTVWPW